MARVEFWSGIIFAKLREVGESGTRHRRLALPVGEDVYEDRDFDVAPKIDILIDDRMAVAHEFSVG